ncbi:3-carboxymuconate cyclase [Paenibacillus swuensis]|uniref:3-carboxymuconate cyclase n=1 Tax=Paenibacillus swuensis TaxID=1178515 RepID=A0A172TMV6_9BACL|nr:lactonase family protein [Paenibacillus swuensis]ANE48224.1 3-carboxymuconate cyclase [Paenibacillus swuensis]
MSSQQHTGRMLVFAGSYAEAGDNSVYVYEFNETSGSLELLDSAAGLKNPTFLNVDASNRKLYAISEVTAPSGKKAGEAVAFNILPSGSIEILNRRNTTEGPTCHIQRDANDRYLVVVSYHEGMAGLQAITEDGLIGQVLDVEQHEGSSVNPERQDRPHPHSAFFSPDNRFLLIPDLGLDRIFTYSIVEESQTLRLEGVTETNPGSGPRHLAFHPSGSYAYVIHEMDSTITAFAYSAENGSLTPVHTISTLPADFAGENSTAEIAVSEDGKYVYGSNRGHDSIAVYAVDVSTGKLSLVQHVSTEGEHPRHFALTPGGGYLLCANRDTNNIAVFKINSDSGRLQYTGNDVHLSKPVCVKPVYM